MHQEPSDHQPGTPTTTTSITALAEISPIPYFLFKADEDHPAQKNIS